MRKISILGSTGSIGTQTLDVVRQNKDLEVVALSAGTNVELLAKQIAEFHPSFVSVAGEKEAEALKKLLGEEKIEILTGMDGLMAVACAKDAEIVVTAIVGMLGIRPTIAAMKAGKDIALANKETLVCAGHLIMPLAKECNVRILPVDSEHSAIFQCLHKEDAGEVERLLITASGGPFRGWKRDAMEGVRVEDALKHPNWAMGRKITIDSATMVNKGLEVMEAKWLFGVDFDHITVVVHPQSVIHSMVQFKDGGVMAQLGSPDMRLPISYALYYPHRRYLDSERLDFAKLSQMTFEAPDPENFRGFALAWEAGRSGGNLPTVFNAANERAVALFLNRQIGFLDIPRLIEESMNASSFIENPSVDDILETERWTYEFIAKSLAK
ncbi:MAG: 1-deoxy-D-xylulose-5-phosphate reductoisomerase [Lachnospiraceae bacterium]|nr:1-deoxy-D-xylulose-5-phosphate reductoisomerase [Lachnospiraceae bacterium]